LHLHCITRHYMLESHQGSRILTAIFVSGCFSLSLGLCDHSTPAFATTEKVLDEKISISRSTLAVMMVMVTYLLFENTEKVVDEKMVTFLLFEITEKVVDEKIMQLEKDCGRGDGDGDGDGDVSPRKKAEHTRGPQQETQMMRRREQASFDPFARTSGHNISVQETPASVSHRMVLQAMAAGRNRAKILALCCHTRQKRSESRWPHLSVSFDNIRQAAFPIFFLNGLSVCFHRSINRQFQRSEALEEVCLWVCYIRC